MNIKAFLFDLDGTLLDTREDVGDAMNRTLISNGYPTHTIDDYARFLGSGARALVIRSLPENQRDDATVDACLKEFQADYLQNCTVKTVPYPGIPELLNKLVAKKLKIGILTNKPDHITRLCVDKLLADWKFDVVIGHRDGQLPKPDPSGAIEAAQEMKTEPVNIIYVGDTEIDVETSRRAGMIPVAVTWGFRSVEDLAKSNPHALVDNPLDLLLYC